MTIKVTEGKVTYGPDGNEIKSKSNEQESQDIIDENKLVNNQQNEGSVEKESKDTEQSVRNNPVFVSQLIDDNSTFSRINTELYKSKQQDTTPDNDLSTDPYIPNSSSNELERIENEVCNDIQGNNKQSSNSIEGKQLQMGGINPQNPNGYASIPQMQPSIPQPQYGDNTPIRMPQPVPYTTNEGNTPIQMPIQPTPQMQPSIPQPQYGDNTPIRMPKPVPYTTNEGNTPTQMQNQPIVQYSQQPFTSKSEISKEEINYNYYAPRVYDDEAGCVTFIKKVKDNIKSGVSLVNYDKVEVLY